MVSKPVELATSGSLLEAQKNEAILNLLILHFNKIQSDLYAYFNLKALFTGPLDRKVPEPELASPLNSYGLLTPTLMTPPWSWLKVLVPIISTPKITDGEGFIFKMNS